MNRYTVEGILRDAAQGKRVGVFAHSRRDLRESFGALTNGASGASRIVRANGRERIDYSSGGSVTFHCVSRGGGRGVEADVAYVEAWDCLGRDAQEDVLVAANRGEVILSRVGD